MSVGEEVGVSVGVAVGVSVGVELYGVRIAGWRQSGLTSVCPSVLELECLSVYLLVLTWVYLSESR